MHFVLNIMGSLHFGRQKTHHPSWDCFAACNVYVSMMNAHIHHIYIVLNCGGARNSTSH